MFIADDDDETMFAIGSAKPHGFNLNDLVVKRINEYAKSKRRSKSEMVNFILDQFLKGLVARKKMVPPTPEEIEEFVKSLK